MTKAIGLVSGGLDSILAVRLLLDLGIEVTALAFTSPFFGADRARAACKQLGVPLIVHDMSEDILQAVRKPKFGYGRNYNPCMDCHAAMVRIAGEIMEREGFDFIFTGEVVGQRPFSQNIRSLQIVADESGYGDRLLRPLSARRLRMTEMERTGLVDREMLLDIWGRGRKRQIELARQWGIKGYSNPAGGCLLTDVNFSARMREAFADGAELTVELLDILKVGRQFRISPRQRIAVGKNDGDNQALAKHCQETGWLAKIDGCPGPTAVFSVEPDESEVLIAGRLLARYADIKAIEGSIVVKAWRKDEAARMTCVVEVPMTPDEALTHLIAKDNGRKQ
jgi:hypothetical protein